MAGYATGMVGKWHLGSHDEYHPLSRGFDEFFGFYSGATMYINRNTGEAVKADGRIGGQAARRKLNKIYRGRKQVRENEYLTDVFTREALDFIERHQNHPFFLYLPYNAVHTPLQVTKKYYDRFRHIKNNNKRIYAAMTSALDDGVGAVLNKLKETNLDKDTLVIFLSDNGCANYTRICSNHPLRMGKLWLLEGGTRVPFALMWPGHIPAGKVFTHQVSSLDIFPTALKLAGSDANGLELDGVDLMPYLTGKTAGAPHEMLFWRHGRNYAVRKGNWKLFKSGGHTWLFDIKDDIGEMTNQAERHPAMVKELEKALGYWEKGLVEPAWPSKRVIKNQRLDGKEVEIFI